MDKGLFFNVLCLEETGRHEENAYLAIFHHFVGAIQLLLSEYVEQNQSKKRIMEVFLQKSMNMSQKSNTI